MFFTQYLFPGGGITPPGGMKLRNPWGGGQFLRTSHMYIYFDVIFAHVIYMKNLFRGGITDPWGVKLRTPRGGGQILRKLAKN